MNNCNYENVKQRIENCQHYHVGCSKELRDVATKIKDQIPAGTHLDTRHNTTSFSHFMPKNMQHGYYDASGVYHSL